MRSWLAPLLVLGISACGGEEAPLPATSPPPAPAPAPTPAPDPEPTDDEAAGSLRGDERAGARVYQQFCATCHGPEGRGDGPAALTEPRPADHTDAAYMGSLSDEHLYQVISKGGASVGKSPLMAPWGAVLSDEQIRDVLAFVRLLSGT